MFLYHFSIMNTNIAAIINISLLTPWAGNYFLLRAILVLYLCPAGQYHVKYTISKLIMLPLWAGCGPRAESYPRLP